MDLFDHAAQERLRQEAPLAARMRPRTLDEFVGQEAIVGPGRLLRRAIQADQLSSLIFYGPPGTGKTTLARVIANSTRSHFTTINAVLAGVKDIRAAIAQAQEQRKMYQRRTILFVDEVHRFNKAQQDALLPWVENGTIILIGATTENPYFSVNRALVSRSRVFQLKPLTDNDLRRIARQALADPERGYGRLNVHIDEDALNHLVRVANGDARALLNALELAVETTLPDENGVIVIDMTVAEESIQKRAVLYDKEGDYHFDTISAFIKSLRGSDPDAAMYWLAKMVYAGEDPRFIFRRMLIFAGEDVGLADPNALALITAAAAAFDRVGLPEGRFHLAEAALYLATAPKSNSTFAFFDALHAVEEETAGEVPAHLRDASRDKQKFGHGEGYLYPHAYQDHWVAQQYLPNGWQGVVFYQPGDLGYEGKLKATIAQRREAQIAAMTDESEAHTEVLTFAPAQKSRERWLQRTISQRSAGLEKLRTEIFAAAQLQRHHVVLDLNAESGLLTWEAVRSTPEGGVWALAWQPKQAAALAQLAQQLPPLDRPVLLVAKPPVLPVTNRIFDRVLGKSVLHRRADKQAILAGCARLLRPGGRLVLAEPFPRQGERLSRLVDLTSLPADLRQRLYAAEAAIYDDPSNPLVNWDRAEVEAYCRQAGLAHCRTTLFTMNSRRQMTPAVLDRWLNSAAPGQPPSFADRLREQLSDTEIEQVVRLFRSQLQNKVVAWRHTYLLLTARAASAP